MHYRGGGRFLVMCASSKVESCFAVANVLKEARRSQIEAFEDKRNTQSHFSIHRRVRGVLISDDAASRGAAQQSFAAQHKLTGGSSRIQPQLSAAIQSSAFTDTLFLGLTRGDCEFFLNPCLDYHVFAHRTYAYAPCRRGHGWPAYCVRLRRR